MSPFPFCGCDILRCGRCAYAKEILTTHSPWELTYFILHLSSSISRVRSKPFGPADSSKYYKRWATDFIWQFCYGPGYHCHVWLQDTMIRLLVTYRFQQHL